MDPKLTLKLFTKNAYFATKTPRKHLDHQKKKKFKKNFFPQNDSIRRENRSKNFFGKKSFLTGTWSFFRNRLGSKKSEKFFFYF